MASTSYLRDDGKRVIEYTSSGGISSDTYVIPAGVYSVELEADGGGGGGGTALINGGGGGGGGAYARTNALAVNPGDTLTIQNVIASATNDAVDAWASKTGVLPTTTAQGVRARGGTKGVNGSATAAGAGGAGGTTAASVGDVKFAGGTGGTATTAGGGGGGSGGAGGAGANGVATAGGAAGAASAPRPGGGAGGNGAAVGGNGTAGVAPGGGGGGASTTGAATAGAASVVRIIFTEVGNLAASVATATSGEAIAETPGTVSVAVGATQSERIADSGGVVASVIVDHYREQVLADSPSFYWRLNDPSKAHVASLADASPNARSGFYFGANMSDSASLLADDPDHAAHMPGGAQAYLFGTTAFFAATLWASRSSWTYEAWVSMDSLPGAGAGYMLFCGGNPNNQTGFYSYVDSAGKVRFAPDGNSGTVTLWNTSLVAGTPYHIAFAFSNTGSPAGAVTLYVNGVSQGTQLNWADFAPAGSSGNDAFRCGSWEYSGPTVLWTWLGVIDEVAVYSGVLAPSRISAHYAAGASRHSSEAIAERGDNSAVVALAGQETLAEVGSANIVVSASAAEAFVDLGSVALVVSVAQREALADEGVDFMSIALSALEALAERDDAHITISMVQEWQRISPGLSGTVYESTGSSPVAGAQVLVFRDDTNDLISALTSDGSGQWAIDLDPAYDYWVSGWKAGSPDADDEDRTQRAIAPVETVVEVGT